MWDREKGPEIVSHDQFVWVKRYDEVVYACLMTNPPTHLSQEIQWVLPYMANGTKNLYLPFSPPSSLFSPLLLSLLLFLLLFMLTLPLKYFFLAFQSNHPWKNCCHHKPTLEPWKTTLLYMLVALSASTCPSSVRTFAKWFQLTFSTPLLRKWARNRKWYVHNTFGIIQGQI